MRGDQRLQLVFPISAVEPLPDNAVRVGHLCKIAFGVEHKCHAAGHACTKVAANLAQDNRHAAGHIFETV